MAQAAPAIGVTKGHLKGVVFGRVRPNSIVREKLPELVGVPLEDLFTDEVLERPYDASKNPWKPVV